MTTSVLQLASRICRSLKARDIHSLPADDATEVLDAINGAITEYFAVAPSTYRMKSSVIFDIPAPQNISVTATNGSTHAATLAPELIGHSIQMPGDAQMNRIVAENTLAVPYRGPSGASIPARIYADVIPLGDNFARFSGDPQVYNQGNFVRYLTRQPEESYFLGEVQVGFPLRFVVEAMGQASGASPYFQMRLLPAPADGLTLKVMMEVRPEQYNLAQLTSTTRLPVPEEHAFAVLLPMALMRLVGGPLWPQDSDPKVAQTNLDRALSILGKVSPDAGPGLNRVMTPWRY